MRLSCENKLDHGYFVPISIEKSKWVVDAILAVLKAGGAFLLLHTSQPTSIYRQNTFCQKVAAQVILASTTKKGAWEAWLEEVEYYYLQQSCFPGSRAWQRK